MKTVSLHDAKTNLSKYIAAAKRGEKIAIGAYGKQEVWLTNEAPKKPSTDQATTASKPIREFGTLKGKVWISPDAFSKEVDEEIWADFYADLDKHAG